MTTIQEPTLTTARKVYSCDFCCSEIQRRAPYMRSTYKYDTIYTWRTHEKCYNLSVRLNMYEGMCEGVSADDFESDTKEAYYYMREQLGLECSKDVSTKEQVDFLTATFDKIDNTKIFEFKYGDDAIDWITGKDQEAAIKNLVYFTGSTKEEILENCQIKKIDWKEAKQLDNGLWEAFVLVEPADEPLYFTTEYC
ncbi:MAG: hypothetical protein ACRBFS_10525 [Aureispira sp.]